MALTFLTTSELRARLQNPDLDEAAAQSAIDAAVGLVKSVSGQDLEYVTGDVIELAGGTDRVTLPQRPVVAVSSVSELDFAGNATPMIQGQSWFLQGSQLVRSWPGALWAGNYGWSGRAYWNASQWWPGQAGAIWGPRVRIVYSHGYQSDSALPKGLKSILLSLAQREAVNPGMLREEEVGGVHLVYSTESLGGSSSTLAALRKDLQALGLRRGGAFSIGG